MFANVGLSLSLSLFLSLSFCVCVCVLVWFALVYFGQFGFYGISAFYGLFNGNFVGQSYIV